MIVIPTAWSAPSRYTTRSPIALAAKRTIDLVGGGAALIAFSPVIGAVAVLVRLTMGRPVFFRQMRLGWHERPFSVFKFRTMADTRDVNGNLLSDEARLTPIGRFLRATTLDELPELFNVMLGEMSLVGPRPLMAEYRDVYTPDQRRRHEMPPGMAGPVVAYGRNALSWDEKFALDRWYVDNWSLWLDARIMARALLQVVRREGVSAAGHATMPRLTEVASTSGIADEPPSTPSGTHVRGTDA